MRTDVATNAGHIQEVRRTHSTDAMLLNLTCFGSTDGFVMVAFCNHGLEFRVDGGIWNDSSVM